MLFLTIVPVLQVRLTSHLKVPESLESPEFWETPQVTAKPDEPKGVFHPCLESY